MKTEVPRPVRLRWFTSPQQAEFAKLALEVEGIHSTTTGADLASMLSYYGQAVTRVELYVDASDRERAEKVLSAPDTEPGRTEDWGCSYCGEPNGAALELCWACQASVEEAADEPAARDPASNPDQERRVRIRRAVLLGILFPVPIGIYGLAMCAFKALSFGADPDLAVRRILQGTLILILVLMCIGMEDFVRLLLSMVPGTP